MEFVKDSSNTCIHRLHDRGCQKPDKDNEHNTFIMQTLQKLYLWIPYTSWAEFALLVNGRLIVKYRNSNKEVI